MTMLLLFSCLSTPVQIALFEEMGTAWKAINYAIDALFLIDVFIIFNSATYDEDFVLETNRQAIAAEYLSGWFLIDIVAIIPFEAVF